jgi:methionyl-tRNA synthetase
VADPVELAGRYGTDAVRWWLLREVPRVGDADFTVERLVERANQDLANGLGNLVSRVTSLVYARDQQAAESSRAEPREPEEAARAAAELREAIDQAPGRVRAGLDDYDFRAAAAAIWAIVDRANRYAELSEPWRLARAARDGDLAAAAGRDLALGRLLAACRALAGELAPFVPGLAASIGTACGGPDGAVPQPRPLFPRLTAAEPEQTAGPQTAGPQTAVIKRPLVAANKSVL